MNWEQRAETALVDAAFAAIVLGVAIAFIIVLPFWLLGKSTEKLFLCIKGER